MSESIERTLGRLEAKVDTILAAQATSVTTAEAVASRVTKLERWQAGLVGGGAAVGALITMLIRFVS